MKLVTTKFKSGGLHEKHVVATWNLGTISAFFDIYKYVCIYIYIYIYILDVIREQSRCILYGPIRRL